MAPCWRGPTGLLLAALGPALAARSVLEQTPTKRYPVSGVVELLRNMKMDVEKQADADEEVYDKLACWCTTNDKGKTKAISDGEARVSDLTSTIDRTSALTQTLTVEITSLDEELAKNQLSLEQATALRTKQHAEFIAEEKEMIQSIQALQAAIVVLAKHHGGGGASLLSGEALAAAAVAAGRLQKHTSLLEGTLTPSQKRAVRALLTQQSPGGYFDAAPTFKQAYKPQSGEIFGILKEMKATFEADLAASQKEEIENQQAYDQVKSAKEYEIQAGQASSRDKQQQRADADERLAQSKQDREDTAAAVSADKKFLTELKLKCAMTDKEWADRKQARQDELSAITEAIALLTSDDARDLFSRTYNQAAFIQRNSRQVSVREQVASLLYTTAGRTRSAGLLALAGRVKLDAFVRVKQAIDEMVTQLLQEKELEIQHKDWCVDQLAKSERASEKQAHTKASLDSKIENLQLTIAGLNSTIGKLQSEITDLGLQKKRAKEDRDLEHQEFQTTLADQKTSRQLLEQALAMLSRIYAPQSLVQTGAQPTLPPGFGTLEKHGGGAGVLSLITHIIEDTKKMEASLLQDETDAQDAYTKLVQDTTNSVAAKQASVLDRTTEMTGKQQELVQAKSELDGTVTEMQALSENTAALHGSCDFVLKNFDLRQAARDEEVAALRQAKAYLAGMRSPAA